MRKVILAVFITPIISSLCYGANLNSLNKEQFIAAFVNKTSVSIPTDNLNGRTIANTFSMFLDNQGHNLTHPM
jgi:hypothetical protein